MVSYKFYRTHNGRLMIQLPKELSLFEDFIELIATEEEANEYIDIIDRVLIGTYEDFEIVLNAPGVIIKPDTTTVYNEFVQGPPFEKNTMRTKDFRKLIMIWKNKIPERFLEDKRS